MELVAFMTTEADQGAAGSTDRFLAIPIITNAVTTNRQTRRADTTASQCTWTGGNIICFPISTTLHSHFQAATKFHTCIAA